ncbi:hypothetical protein BTO06_18095 [Tenacibaculum sp. SZ-18]|uniref:contractile injection system tape measure protein n=1 Tax=Tenacibaculum sp. SZ-18 TaxID=754423 RepID=UPI000C2D30FE|nr:contractile injection system tape measure protein [Tenacibaculum sp. SZ-18]AUC16942.1 hypothetical protein BTO06_18095 [Tenacibaculum sp. SZ-18]
MRIQEHIINKVVVDINTSSKKVAEELKNSVDTFLKEEIFPLIESFFESISTTDQIIKLIPKLNLNIDLSGFTSSVSSESFKIEVKRNISDQLKEIINQPEVHNIEITEKSVEKSKADTFFYFMENGTFSWWNNYTENYNFTRKDLFEITETVNYNSSFFNLLKSVKARIRLLNQFLDEELQLLFLGVSQKPQEYVFLLNEIISFNKKNQTNNEFRKEIWNAFIELTIQGNIQILFELLLENQLFFENNNLQIEKETIHLFIKSIFQNKPEVKNLLPTSFLDNLLEVKFCSPNLNVKPEYKKTDKNQDIKINTELSEENSLQSVLERNSKEKKDIEKTELTLNKTEENSILLNSFETKKKLENIEIIDAQFYNDFNLQRENDRIESDSGNEEVSTSNIKNSEQTFSEFEEKYSVKPTELLEGNSTTIIANSSSNIENKKPENEELVKKVAEESSENKVIQNEKNASVISPSSNNSFDLKNGDDFSKELLISKNDKELLTKENNEENSSISNSQKVAKSNERIDVSTPKSTRPNNVLMKEVAEVSSRKNMKHQTNQKPATLRNLKELFNGFTMSKSYIINNAGLILIHPFLKQFFASNNLLNDHNQIIKTTEAVHLLHYVATKKEKQIESNLIFEKFLCNVPIEESIDRNITLTDEMKESAENLLESVVFNWEILKSSSPDLIRNEFIQRQGKLDLTKENPQITIERKTQDILLDKLPWNYSLCKLPWMKKLLFTDW